MSDMASRLQRTAAMALLAADHDGVAHRRDLARYGIDHDDIRSEVRAGRWSLAGWHTVVDGTTPPTGRAHLWRAVWESGSGAALDGAAALIAGGLTGFTTQMLDVSLPHSSTPRSTVGVRAHRTRRLPPLVDVGIPRVRPEFATIRAAAWAASERQAALLLCLPVQQRIVSPARLLEAWASVRRTTRRDFLQRQIADLCSGTQSLGELDFAALCRRHGLPPPSRQVLQKRPSGTSYLDVRWDAVGLVVEIDGEQHSDRFQAAVDALSRNECVIDGDRVLRVPTQLLLTQSDQVMGQIMRCYLVLAAAKGILPG